jgi:flagellar motor switch protein FliG
VEVIQWVDRNTERMIFDYLTDNNPELAEEVRKLMFTFEDLLQLDDRAIQQILKEVDMKELSLALKGASDALKDKIFRNMSERAVNMLKEELEFMGPVRVRDVEEAQQRVVSIVRRMEEAGEIVISRGGEEEMLI